MQDKHKVTLYLPPALHRQLKVRSAVDLQPMSAIAERALIFYLEHPEMIDEVEESHGQVHRLYSCPSCASSLVLREGEMVPVQEHSAIVGEEVSSVERVQDGCSSSDQHGEGELVPC